MTNEERIKEFTLPQMGSFLRIKKIILTPLFEWKHLDEWSTKLYHNGLIISIHAATSNSIIYNQVYSIAAFNDPSYFQPAFVINPSSVLPDQLRENGINKINYPVKCKIVLSGAVDTFDFEVMLVTDEG